MNFLKWAFSFFIFLFVATSAIAQKDIKNGKEKIFTFTAVAGFHLPGGDLADRFGESATIGAAPMYKTKNNWLLGVEGNFIFGNKIKQGGLFQDLLEANNYVFDEDGQIATVVLFERGFSFYGQVGKVFTLPKFPNPNTGVYVLAGAGFLQHKIRIETQNNVVPQLEDDYAKGYDRLSNGFSLKQSIGWYNLSNSKLTNFTVGLEFIQAFTQSRRDYNFDLKGKDTQKRLDLLMGVKVAWMIPFYKRMATDFYIN